jgi:hypothetical protein
MKKILLLLLMASFCHFCIAQVEKIDPERPDQSESADLLAKKYFQAEFGFNKENSSGKDYDLLYPTTLFKYGLKKIELRLEATVRSSYEHLIPNSKWESGLDPVSLGFKVNLAKEKKFFPKTSFIAGFGIPVFASKNFRADHIAPSLKLAMNNSISDHADLSYNLGAEWDGFSTTPDWLYSVSQNFDFCESWNAYFEVYGFIKKNEAPQHSIDAGVGYCISNDTKVDLSGGLGISSESPKSYVAVGFSFRIKGHNKK